MVKRQSSSGKDVSGAAGRQCILSGRNEEARQFSEQAIRLGKAADLPEAPALWMANAALREAEIGNAERARTLAADAIAMSTGDDVSARADLPAAATVSGPSRLRRG